MTVESTSGEDLEAAAREVRWRDITARCVRQECRLLLDEAEGLAVDGAWTARLVTLHAVLHVFGVYVRSGKDPVRMLMQHPDCRPGVYREENGKRRSADRLAARILVEAERERLGRAYRDVCDEHDAAREACLAFKQRYPPEAV